MFTQKSSGLTPADVQRRSPLEPPFAQKVPKQPDTVAITSEKCKEILTLMETDQNGKFSKQEWMKFTKAEFDRLDMRKTGEIDQKELLQSNVVRGKLRTSDLGKQSLRGSTGRHSWARSGTFLLQLEK